MNRTGTALFAAASVAVLAGCGTSASASTGGALSDQQAISASGAKNCTEDADIVMVRAQYQCAGNLTLSTFASTQVREAMSKVAGSAGFQHVVKEANNWMLTADN